jgi:hypothetical protein
MSISLIRSKEAKSVDDYTQDVELVFLKIIFSKIFENDGSSEMGL